MVKKIALAAIFFYFAAATVAAGEIQYGYNSQGEYVPLSINDKPVQYGYNDFGEFVPLSIGEDKIRYGFNSQSDYVPIYIEDSSDFKDHNIWDNLEEIK